MSTTRWVLLLCAVAGAGAFYVWQKKKPDAAAEAAKGPPARIVPVVAANVERRDVPIYLEGLGNAQASRTVTVRAQVDGRLDAVLFREGQEVKKGMQLAQIDPRPFQIQLHQAEGALARDAASLQAAKLNLKRYQELVGKELVARQQVDDQAAVVGQLEGSVRVDEAAVQSARLNLDYAKILAPIDGMAGIRQVDQGNVVRAADQTGLVVLASLDPIAVVFSLPQDELVQVSGALAGAELPVEAWSRDGSAKLATGKLLLLDNQINSSTATLKLKALFANPQRTLWPSQFIKARLLVATRKDALTVPATAVQRGPDGTFAWVIKDEAVTPRPIEVEKILGDTALLVSAPGKGLEAGEQVVIEGQSQLKPGAKVSMRLAGQPSPGGKGKGSGKGRPQEGGALGARP
jgi:multidrug efflux system membrane fusion protein